LEGNVFGDKVGNVLILINIFHMNGKIMGKYFYIFSSLGITWGTSKYSFPWLGKSWGNISIFSQVWE